ncbi:hypothetical protein [Guptibacillus hwajinpoensis]|uniref:hypothetical protein n=1 Tax=Guptibacillus hwajinpoensis TaxID=208199 RepID=UPI003D6B23B2
MKSMQKKLSRSITTFDLVLNNGMRLRWFTPTQEIHLCGQGFAQCALAYYWHGYKLACFSGV